MLPRGIGAEKILLSRFDVASTPSLRSSECDDPFIDRVYPSIPGEPMVEEPVFYATDSVAPGWSIFVAGNSVSIKALADWISQAAHKSPAELSGDEPFWAEIRRGYRLKPDYINLENGYYNIQPSEILEKYMGHIREVNYQGSYYMRTVQFDNKKKV